MVTIVDYRSLQSGDGEPFFGLVLQGGIEAVKSMDTKRTYLTAKTALVACTFNKLTCETLIGTKLPGRVNKLVVEPYDFLIPGTDEVVELKHRYEYLPDEDDILKNHIVKDVELVV